MKRNILATGIILFLLGMNIYENLTKEPLSDKMLRIAPQEVILAHQDTHITMTLVMIIFVILLNIIIKKIFRTSLTYENDSYKDDIKLFSSTPNDLDYEVIDFIDAESKDELLEKAYELNANALINVQVQKYTSSNTKSHFNGLFVKRSIRTKVDNHENWTASAVRIGSVKLTIMPLKN
jgi:hypothetical protein